MSGKEMMIDKLSDRNMGTEIKSVHTNTVGEVKKGVKIVGGQKMATPDDVKIMGKNEQ